MLILVAILITVAFSAFTIGVFIAMGYYSVRILRSFRGGVLAKGWVPICMAVFFLIAGQILLASYASPGLTETTSRLVLLAGSLTDSIGGLLIAIGFRAQYSAWKVPEKIEAKSAQ